MGSTIDINVLQSFIASTGTYTFWIQKFSPDSNKITLHRFRCVNGLGEDTPFSDFDGSGTAEQIAQSMRSRWGYYFTGVYPFVETADASVSVTGTGTHVILESSDPNTCFVVKYSLSTTPKNVIDLYWNFVVDLFSPNIAEIGAAAAPSNQLNNIKHTFNCANQLGANAVWVLPYSDGNVVFDDIIYNSDYPQLIGWTSAAQSTIFQNLGVSDRHEKSRYAIIYGEFVTNIIGQGIIPYFIDFPFSPTVEKWIVVPQMDSTGTECTLNSLITPIDGGGVADVDVILSWSFDGINYNSLSTPITGLQPNASYQVYVTDQFNGVRTVSFVATPSVDPELIRGVDPFFKIENCNSLKYYEGNAKSPFFDNAKMVDQLYYNIEMQCRKQPVLTTDIITTQIKSTYRDIVVSIVDVDGVEGQAPVVELKIQNTEKNDKRDAVMVRSIDGLNTCIYFGGGNLYTPDTTTVIGTYTGVSTLPSWCQIGMYVLITGGGDGLHQVTDIIYNTSFQKWMLVIDYALAEASIAGTCQSLYNTENYNIYEFDSTFGALPIGDYEIIVNATDEDPTFPPVQWRSEWIKSRATHKKHLTVTYSHDEPINKIDYSTGIEHILHVPARFITYSTKNDSERFDSDDGRVVTLKSINTRVITFETALIPQWLVEKLVYASGHDNLAINGYSCTLVEQPEITPKHEGNNPFYLFKMDLQLNESIIITDSTGIVSESANVLGSTQDTVLGV